jgi:hypothetical protein
VVRVVVVVTVCVTMRMPVTIIMVGIMNATTVPRGHDALGLDLAGRLDGAGFGVGTLQTGH